MFSGRTADRHDFRRLGCVSNGLIAEDGRYSERRSETAETTETSVLRTVGNVAPKAGTMNRPNGEKYREDPTARTTRPSRCPFRRALSKRRQRKFRCQTAGSCGDRQRKRWGRTLLHVGRETAETTGSAGPENRRSRRLLTGRIVRGNSTAWTNLGQPDRISPTEPVRSNQPNRSGELFRRCARLRGAAIRSPNS